MKREKGCMIMNFFVSFGMDGFKKNYLYTSKSLK